MNITIKLEQVSISVIIISASNLDELKALTKEKPSKKTHESVNISTSPKIPKRIIEFNSGADKDILSSIDTEKALNDIL